ncbi:sarcosine oxidase subunit alpha family protein [Meridianimarinicoccus aquatilis]|uniref:Sarcosine oxidase subunit alpha family protein n=1 Tax=Meridianimarinicoccus aquatilis TaxID=2552766 RepID=A0A4R6AUB3_9RHOB|nr:sarcosine oxidase subunit alpha family protein [Fluviibacterium aquatile]TDL85473.1 sarcosine oxidase subunit alpha family protein [Fluviibacterium aquatile]
MTGLQKKRLNGGLIDRSQPIDFTFDGESYTGFAGDTLASALVANDVALLGRSFKYHRPRGLIASGSEEPNALVTLSRGAAVTPNTRATMVELEAGLTAAPQNAWPSVRFDAMAVNDVLAPFLTAGFYYKTFMWPRAFWEKLYEPAIRRAAGLGRLSTAPDPDLYDRGFLHCDLLVVGAGPAGLMAALTAGRAGARVILADEDFALGGRLNAETLVIDDAPASVWLATALAELASLPNVRTLSRTTVFGVFDHGIYGAVEMGAPTAKDHAPRQTLWRIYSKSCTVCAGATERPIAFPDNDRPGIMLAGAARTYVNRWAAAPAQRIAVFTNNDDGHRTAADLAAKGLTIAALIDTRANAPDCTDANETFKGAQVIASEGRLRLKNIMVRTASGGRRQISCGALAVSGGWNPNLHLSAQQRTRPVWNDAVAAFVPAPDAVAGQRLAGAAAGDFSTAGALSGGVNAARAALADLDIKVKHSKLPKADDAPTRITPFWYVSGTKRRAWLDFQNDVTVKDVALAQAEGFRSVEHVKRYTTLGMATDQGRTASTNAIGVMAALTGQDIAQTGTTMFRPPYTPVSMGAFAGRSRGKHFRPTRRTPTHTFAEANGATFVEVGQWLRAQWFTQSGETHWRQSVDREVRAVRNDVGLCDVTTLGKIDVQGVDAAAFLNRIYCNGMAKLPVGRVRYGLMLREDGIAMDDGTAARLGEDHFVVTTTTANAGAVYRHMEFARQCLWPDMDVQLISTTDAWAQIAVAGPKARKLLQRIVDPAHDLSNGAFPFMACAPVTVCGGLRARLFRISFSGELAYEIAVPARYGDALMHEMMAQGQDLGATPYGTEALGVLRIEKGHAAGNELNGRTTAAMLGLGRMVSTAKDSIGAVLSRRAGLAEDTHRLTGFVPVDGVTPIPGGAHLMREGARQIAENTLGWISSAAFSPTLNSPIALGFVTLADARKGQTLRAVSPVDGLDIPVRVVSPHFVDPEGGRQRD